MLHLVEAVVSKYHKRLSLGGLSSAYTRMEGEWED